MVELENTQAATESGAPGTDSVTIPGGETSAAPSGTAGQVTEITEPDRYTYNGRPVKDWTSGYMRQQDYTAKTQELAQERKYYDNLSVDLERVRSNPHLADQFRQIYPEKFHGYLRFIQSQSQEQPQAGQQQTMTRQQYAQLDPREKAEINRLIENNRQREVQAISSEIDSIFARMTQKYPFADEEAVVARGQALFNLMKQQNPTNSNIRISEKQWEALWKSQNDRAMGLSEAQYKKKVQAQIDASRKGGGVGSGGGVPGQAPRQHKTIKEATNAALADIESGAI